MKNILASDLKKFIVVKKVLLMEKLDDDVGLILSDVLDKISEMEDCSKMSKNRPDTTPDLQPKASKIEPLPVKIAIGLGISQSGRVMDPICLQQNIFSSIGAEQLAEYQWPADKSGEYYMLQEQVSTFLNITSFKRKNPEIQRRKLDPAEVNHLLGSHLISEVQVTLGLTALRSSDVCDMMIREYPEKYDEYRIALHERQKKKIQNKFKEYASSAAASVEKSQMPNYFKKAMKQVTEYNAMLNRHRKEDFSVYYDMSTNVLQYPRNKVRKLDPSLTRPSLYPCSVIHGQFQEYYKKYTKNELMYLPLNTALYGPHLAPPEDLMLSVSDIESEAESETSMRVAKSVLSLNNKTKENKLAMEIETIPEKSIQNLENVEDKSMDENAENKENPVSEDETPFCGICEKDGSPSDKNKNEDLIKCSQCDNHGHPSCLEMSSELVDVILTYNWQCMECKTCTICSMPHREDLMMFCDRCDRGYHTFCVSLRAIPSGVWACSRCTYADPDFLKRRRKLLRMSQSPGRGRKRGRQPRNGGTPKATIIVELQATDQDDPNTPSVNPSEEIKLLDEDKPKISPIKLKIIQKEGISFSQNIEDVKADISGGNPSITATITSVEPETT